MALVKVKARHAVDFNDGHSRGPDETINIDVTTPEAVRMLNEGLIEISDGSVDPPAPDPLIADFLGGKGVPTVGGSSADGKMLVYRLGLDRWNLEGCPRLLPLTRLGLLDVETGRARIRLPFAATIVSVAASIDTAPTGSAVIVDVNKNGTTIFTTQANRPQVAAGANASADAVPDVTALAVGDYLTVDIDQVGSTTPGANLTVVVQYR